MPETFTAPTLTAAGTFFWSDYEWAIKDYPIGGEKLGPGPNYWSPDNVLVGDAGSLKLKVTDEGGGNWYSAEIQTVRRLGHGTYRFEVESGLVHDKNLCLAMFTYDEDDPTNAYEEWDIEFSTFNDSNELWMGGPERENAVFVNPNSPTPGAGGTAYWSRYYFDGTELGTVHEIDWNPKRTHFRSKLSNGTVVHEWETRVDHYVYDDATLVLNHWLVGGNAPSDGQPSEKIITAFTFDPHVRYNDRMLSKEVTVSTADTAVMTTEVMGSASRPTVAVVKAPSANTNPVFIGGEDSGDRVFSLAAGESVTIPLVAGDSLYAHVASGTEDLEVLWNG